MKTAGAVFLGIAGVITVILWILGRDPPDCEEKDFNPLKRFIRGLKKVSAVISEKLLSRQIIRLDFSNAEADLSKIHTGLNRETVKNKLFTDLVSVVISGFLCGMALAGVILLLYKPADILSSENLIKRNEPGRGARRAEIVLNESGKKKEIVLDVPERKYTDDELGKAFKKGESYIRSVFAGKNQSLSCVEKDLKLTDHIPDTGITVEWEISEPDLVGSDGRVDRVNMKKDTLCYLTAMMKYGKKSKKIDFTVNIKKPDVMETRDQKIQKEIKRSLKENPEADYACLPEKIEGKDAEYFEKSESSFNYLLLALISSVVFVYVYLTVLHSKASQRDEQIRRGYPDFLEKFILLMGAGLTVRGVWIRMTDDYIKRREGHRCGKNYLYEEMVTARYAMENGESEAKAISDFGKRAGEISYLKFSSLIDQNLRKGTSDLLKLLDMEAHESLKIRKDNALQLGEKAGTKMLIPMVMMLIVVIWIIVYAAFQEM